MKKQGPEKTTYLDSFHASLHSSSGWSLLYKVGGPKNVAKFSGNSARLSFLIEDWKHYWF